MLSSEKMFFQDMGTISPVRRENRGGGGGAADEVRVPSGTGLSCMHPPPRFRFLLTCLLDPAILCRRCGKSVTLFGADSLGILSMEMPRNERRKSKRVHFIKEIEVVGVGVRRCSDIGLGGIYLETVSSFPAGSVLKVRFKLDDSDERPIEVQVRVQYEHDGMGMGLTFIDLSPEDQERIKKFIDHRATGHS